MNRGVLQVQSSPVQQLMPNQWNNNNVRPIIQPSQGLSPPFLPPPSSHFPQYAPPHPPNSSSWHDNHQQVLPESWSTQLLMGGLVVEEDKSGFSHIQQQAKKLDNWEELLMLHHHHQQQQLQQTGSIDPLQHDVKQENSSKSYHVFGCDTQVEAGAKPTWPHMIPVSSPNSCVTSLSTNMLDFSNTKTNGTHPLLDRSSECISTSSGGTAKKARVHPSSTQTTFKVRKEKLGDRVTALHQMVSPFGKTDTASVLLEAIGYIRFLQSQIEALSLPYLGSGSGNKQQSVQGERTCLFPEDPGQLLNDNCLKRKAAPDQESNEKAMKDLKSRGLCLVPISCTVQVGSDNGADYWGPASLGGGFH